MVGVGNVAIDVARILCRDAGGAGEDRHRRPCAGGLARQPGAGGLPARAARAGPGGVHQSRRSRSWASWPPPTSCVEPEEVELDDAQPGVARAERRPRHAQEGRDPPELRAAPPPAPGRRSSSSASSSRRWSCCERDGAVGGDPARAQRLVASATGTHPGQGDGSVRGAAGRARVPLGRLPRRAAAGRALRREVGRRPEREGPRARPGHRRAAASASTPRAGSSAGHRRHRHQQGRRRRDGAGDGRRPRRRPHAGTDGARPRRRWSDSFTSVSPSTSRTPTG